MRKSIKVWPSVPVLAVVFTLFLMFNAIPGTPADPPIFIPFDIPGAVAVQTRGHDINPAGQVVGQYLGVDGVWHGFLLPKGVFGLSEGVFETIDVPGATMTRPRGINPSGQIVGEYTDGAGVSHGYLLSEGNVTVLDPPGATFASASKINPDGDVVGHYTMSGTTYGFLWSQYTGFTTIDHPEGANTQARGINPDGDIVGYYWGPGPNAVFVRSYDGTYTTKDVSAAIDNPAGSAINPGGQIVGDGRRPGSLFPPPNGRFGFLLTERGVSYFQVVPGPLGNTYTYPFGISANGWIVGFYQDYTSTGDGGKRHGFLVHRSSLE